MCFSGVEIKLNNRKAFVLLLVICFIFASNGNMNHFKYSRTGDRAINDDSSHLIRSSVSGNTPPLVSNLLITPANPKTTDDLTASYDYIDADGDPEGSSLVLWFKDGVAQPAYENLTIIPSFATKKGEAWNFSIEPSDSIDNGAMQTIPPVIIQNTPPIASFMVLAPGSPITTDNLVASWTYSDVDSDPQFAFSINWYKNGVLQSSLANLITVGAGNTTKGENWNYTLRVFDGTDWSIAYNSSMIQILNAAPIIPGSATFNKTINVLETDTLEIVYIYSDIDGDVEGSPTIYWYKNNASGSFYIPSKDNHTILYSFDTSDGDFWYYIIRVFDGQDYSTNYISDGVSINFANAIPTVSDLTITSGNHTTDELVASYVYYDLDNHQEAGTIVVWYLYRSGTIALQHDYNNTLTVPASATQKDDQWWFGVHPKDGLDFGAWMNSSAVTIFNAAPTVTGLTITSSPKTVDDLVASWTFIDDDPIDFQIVFSINWYKNGVLQSSLVNLTTVGAGNTIKGESWNYTLRVFDGTDWSINYSSPMIQILNAAPVTSNLILSPSNPSSTDDLTASYDYIDADSDPESSTKIIWFKDGVLQAALNGTFVVSSSYTGGGEHWYFQVQSFDGTDYGKWFTSPVVIIASVANTPPVAGNLTITPANPKTTDSLTASYDYFDADGDPEGSSLILWFKDGITQPAYENLTMIPSTATNRGEAWNFSIQPSDGIDNGAMQTIPSVIIENTLPVASSLVLTPTSPVTTDNLVGSWTFSDNDMSDTQVDYSIDWYKNGVLQPSLANLTTVGADNTTKGDSWNYTLRVFDGTDWSIIYSSPMIQILNAAPVTSNLIISPSSPSSIDDLTASYNYFDADSDPESGTEIIWFKNGVLQAALNDTLVVSSSYTADGENWNFQVLPFDGTDHGSWTTSPAVVIGSMGNDPPEIQDISFNSNNPTTIDDLEVFYVYYDSNSDPEGLTMVQWFTNGVEVTSNENQTTFSSDFFVKGDVIFVIITPYDGVDYGLSYNSSDFTGLITIINSIPVVTGIGFIFEHVGITPVNASRDFVIDDEPLRVDYTFEDVDTDPDESIIHWYRNGELQDQYTNLTTVPAESTSPGETWLVIIIPHDGVEAGSQVISINLTVESRPIIFDHGAELQKTEKGAYHLWVQTTDERRTISQVIFDVTVIELNYRGTWARFTTNGTPDIYTWENFNLLTILRELEGFDEADFADLIDTMVTVQITVYTEIIGYVITSSVSFNFTIEDIPITTTTTVTTFTTTTTEETSDTTSETTVTFTINVDFLSVLIGLSVALLVFQQKRRKKSF
jgi:hypothetical protein